MDYKLFMVLLGCRPAGRNTEQHDIFFGISKQLRDLIPEIQSFWKGSGKIHIDGWRIVKNVDDYQITISEKTPDKNGDKNLFFLNLGGYKPGEFEEFHYKILSVSKNKGEAIATAKETTFFKHTGFGQKATSHVDDKYGVDVDDFFEIKEILSDSMKEKFSIHIAEIKNSLLPQDEINLGYFKLDAL
jgi:hypothetical protein